MKTSILKSVSLLIMFAIFIGCSSDSDSNSQSPTPCPQGYTGTYCNIPITPTKIKITKFRVTNFPNVNSSSSWDFGTSNESNPDIYLQLGSYITESYYNNVLSNGTNSFDFTPTTPIEITNVNDLKTIYLGDWDLSDSPSNSNDQMALINFIPYQPINGFPSTLTLVENNTTSAFKVELTLTYEW